MGGLPSWYLAKLKVSPVSYLPSGLIFADHDLLGILALTLLVLLELVAEYFYLELGWLQGIVFLFHQSVVDSLHVLAASPAAILSLNRADVFLSIQYYLAKARSCRMHPL